MDEDIGLSNEETVLPESGTGEAEHIDNPIETDAGIAPEPKPESAADDTGEAGEGEEAEDPQRKPVPYDRFKKVNEERKAFAKALEAAGMRFDEETQTAVPIAQDDGLDWDTPTETQDDDGIDPETFWNMKPVDMANNDAWREIAERFDFDPDEAVANEWATIKNIARAEAQQVASQQAQAQAAEVTARGTLNAQLKAIRSDAEFSQSPKAVAFVDAEVKRFQKAGYSASQIQAIVPGIQAKAYYENRGDYVKAEAQRLARGESARTVRMGAQSPESAPDKGNKTYTVTPEMRRMADAFGTDAQRLAAEVARIQGEER